MSDQDDDAVADFFAIRNARAQRTRRPDRDGSYPVAGSGPIDRPEVDPAARLALADRPGTSRSAEAPAGRPAAPVSPRPPLPGSGPAPSRAVPGDASRRTGAAQRPNRPAPSRRPDLAPDPFGGSARMPAEPALRPEVVEGPVPGQRRGPGPDPFGRSASAPAEPMRRPAVVEGRAWPAEVPRPGLGSDATGRVLGARDDQVWHPRGARPADAPPRSPVAPEAEPQPGPDWARRSRHPVWPSPATPPAGGEGELVEYNEPASVTEPVRNRPAAPAPPWATEAVAPVRPREMPPAVATRVQTAPPPDAAAKVRALAGEALLVGKGATKRLRWEQRSYWRNPAAAGFTFLFPLVFFFIFMAIEGNVMVQVGSTRMHFAQYFVPRVISFGLISVCYGNLALNLVFRREFGILKRIRATPAPPTVYLAGIVLNGVVIAAMLAVATTVFGMIFYGVEFPTRLLGLVVAIAAGGFCFSSVAVALSAFIPNDDAAPAIVNLILFPLAFLSGTFQEIRSSATSSRIASVFPIRHLNQLFDAVYAPGGGGLGIVVRHVVMLLLWGAVCLYIGTRQFRWEARRS